MARSWRSVASRVTAKPNWPKSFWVTGRPPPDESTWAGHDSTLLMRRFGFDGPVLIDQGTSDQFLDLLKPEALAEAMAARRQGGTLRMQRGYDHSYYFVSSFIEDHLAFHADALNG